MYEKIENVKNHIQENRKTYLVGVGCMVSGAILGIVVTPNVVNVVDSMKITIIKWKSPTTTTVITVLERRACMDPIPIRCIETGEVFGSIRRAGELLKIPRCKIADQIRGLTPTANDLTFESVVAK